MNAIELARQGYAPKAFPLKSERAVEAQIIGQVTARLRKSAANADRDFPTFVQAMHDNRKMWTMLALDVADSDNGLEQTLRAQIFYLAEFTEQHTVKVLRGAASADALIEINTAILRGLNAAKGA